MKIIIVLAAVIVLTSCSKSPSGRAYLNSGSGVVVPIPNLKIEVIKESDFDAYMGARKQEAWDQAKALQEKLAKMREEFKAAQERSWDTTRSNNAIIQKESSEKYDALMEEATNLPVSVNKITTALNALIRQYGRAPELSSSRYTPQQRVAFAQEEQYQARLSALRRRAPQLKLELAEVERRADNRLAWQSDASQMQGTLNARFLKEVSDEIDKLKSVDYYLGSFNPSSIETEITDSDGKYQLRHISSGELIFAKLVISSTEGRYWVLKPSGEKVDLTDENSYKLPSQFALP